MNEIGTTAGPGKPSAETSRAWIRPEASSSVFRARRRITAASKAISWKPIEWPSKIAVVLINIYRLTFGAILGGRCRFYPSCSVYSQRAIEKYGLLRGSALALWRLVRCNPFNLGGVDEP